MGLSRYEQRVLQEIERWFHRTDPDFAIAMSALPPGPGPPAETARDQAGDDVTGRELTMVALAMLAFVLLLTGVTVYASRPSCIPPRSGAGASGVTPVRPAEAHNTTGVLCHR
ncbi:DUF3040 domain-containing protein [Spongiactinospora sp. 9N601]|uniref:DUF3040 domain-containing protein n=1 Tax=Spongiactinospora sp. 9N601 TaxID=3375149 RepID=UPI0037B1E124